MDQRAYTKVLWLSEAIWGYRLGGLYSEGRGVPMDERKAVELFRKAAEQSLPAAQYRLGIMYAKGTGVHKSDVKAYAWISVAASLSYEPAAAWLLEMESLMPEAQRLEGQDLADKLFALL